MVTRIIERVAGKPKKHHYQKVSITALFFFNLKKNGRKTKERSERKNGEKVESKK